MNWSVPDALGIRHSSDPAGFRVQKLKTTIRTKSGRRPLFSLHAPGKRGVARGTLEEVKAHALSLATDAESMYWTRLSPNRIDDTTLAYADRNSLWRAIGSGLVWGLREDGTALAHDGLFRRGAKNAAIVRIADDDIGVLVCRIRPYPFMRWKYRPRKGRLEVIG